MKPSLINFKPLLLATNHTTPFLQWKSPSPVVLSYQNTSTVFTFKWCLICEHFCPIQTRPIFHWRKQYCGERTQSQPLVEIEVSWKKEKSWWICFLQTYSFSPPKMLTDGLQLHWLLVDYMLFLSAVWTLIMTAPIHCWGSIGEQVMQN